MGGIARRGTLPPTKKPECANRVAGLYTIAGQNVAIDFSQNARNLSFL